MMRALAELESILRRRVCAVCADSAGDTECGRSVPDTCSLFALFPEVARAILATDSDDLRDYVRAIREHVCSLCGEQRLDGSCSPEDRARCALDAHLPVVVDAIEEATGKTFDRTSLAGVA